MAIHSSAELGPLTEMGNLLVTFLKWLIWIFLVSLICLLPDDLFLAYLREHNQWAPSAALKIISDYREYIRSIRSAVWVELIMFSLLLHWVWEILRISLFRPWRRFDAVGYMAIVDAARYIQSYSARGAQDLYLLKDANLVLPNTICDALHKAARSGQLPIFERTQAGRLYEPVKRELWSRVAPNAPAILNRGRENQIITLAGFSLPYYRDLVVRTLDLERVWPPTISEVRLWWRLRLWLWNLADQTGLRRLTEHLSAYL